MNRVIYNAALSAGLVSIGAGAYLVAGLGVALITIGVLMVALTLFGAVFTARRG